MVALAVMLLSNAVGFTSGNSGGVVIGKLLPGSSSGGGLVERRGRGVVRVVDPDRADCSDVVLLDPDLSAPSGRASPLSPAADPSRGWSSSRWEPAVGSPPAVPGGAVEAVGGMSPELGGGVPPGAC